MDQHAGDTRTDTDLLDSIDQVLDETTPDTRTRRGLVTTAGGLLAAGTALALPGATSAATTPTRKQVTGLLATFETFGVTLLSEAVRRAPGTPSARFADVVKAANTAEFLHLEALRDIGGRSQARRFWIPDSVFDGNAGVFAAVAQQEEVEISSYLLALTSATRRRDAKEARLYAEALGTEAEHRVLARFAVSSLTGEPLVPNDRGFEAFRQKTVASAVRATERLGIGIGEQGRGPGRFYTYGGDPRRNGTGSKIAVTRPS
jgi:hypothetical protein